MCVQYSIPLVGMLLGNALNGVTVGVKTFLETLSAERAAIDWALALGATRFEALKYAPHLVDCANAWLLHMPSLLTQLLYQHIQGGSALVAGNLSQGALKLQHLHAGLHSSRCSRRR